MEAMEYGTERQGPPSTSVTGKGPGKPDKSWLASSFSKIQRAEPLHPLYPVDQTFFLSGFGHISDQGLRVRIGKPQDYVICHGREEREAWKSLASCETTTREMPYFRHSLAMVGMSLSPAAL